MLTLYAICLLVGLVYAVLSFFLSGSYEDPIREGADAGGQADAGVHIPFLNPLVIASLVGFFGAGGLIARKVFFLLPGLCLIVALVFSLGMSLLVGWFLMRIYKHQPTSATPPRDAPDQHSGPSDRGDP